jgi:hypothetical protein
MTSNTANLNIVESNTLPSNVIVYTSSNVLVGNPSKLGFDTTSNVILTSNIGGIYGAVLTKGVFQQITERGMAIQIEENVDNEVQFHPAKNNVPSAMPAVGLSLARYGSGDEGYAVTSGVLQGVSGADTFVSGTVLSSSSVGQIVYVSSVNGKLTLTRPTTSNQLIQPVGVIREVTNAGATCDIDVFGMGQYMDTPNSISTIQGTIQQYLTIGNNSLNTSSNLYVYGNVSADYFVGNGSTLTALTGAGAAVYGNATSIPSITVDATGRITSISNNIVQTGSSNLHQVLETGNVSSNSMTVASVNLSAGSGNVVSTTGNIAAGYYHGNASSLVSLTGASAATYGNATSIPSITVDATGRITSISNNIVQTGSSNLHQVLNTGNVSSNSMTVQGISVKDLTISNGIVMCDSTSNTLKTTTNMIFNDADSILTVDGVYGGIVGRTLFECKFDTATAIGDPMYISGFNGSHILVDHANAYVPTEIPVIGLSLKAYSHNDFGYVVTHGVVLNVAKSIISGTIATGKIVYAYQHATMTTVRPFQVGVIIQQIGIITKVYGSSVDIVVNLGLLPDNQTTITNYQSNILAHATIGGNTAINTSSNLYVYGNAYINSTSANALTTSSNISANYYLGNASTLTSLTGASEAVYGNAISVPSITVDSTGRITGISPTTIQSSNLQQVLTAGAVSDIPITIIKEIFTYTAFSTNGGIYAGNYSGDASNLSSLTGAAADTYGNSFYIPSITVDATGRITDISLAGVAGATASNLEQVVNTGNVSSNSITVASIELSGTSGNTVATTGNVSSGYYYGNAATLMSLTGATEAVYGNATSIPSITVDSTGRITSISNNIVQTNSNINQVLETGNVSSNSMTIASIELSGTDGNVVTTTGNITAGYYYGNAFNLIDITDASAGTYGNGTSVASITVNATGRITGISNITITSNLQQVTDNGNITSNTIQFTNTGNSIVTSGTANVANIVVQNAIGATPTQSGSNVLTINQNSQSYKFFRLLNANATISALTFQNQIDGSQSIICVYPRARDTDVFANLMTAGGPRILENFVSNVIINSASYGLITCFYENGNTFVSISTYV